MKNLNTSVLLRTNVIIMLLAVMFSSVFAKENVVKKKQANNLKSVAAGCTPSTAKEELAVNNVRTTILVNGDMWWNAMALEGPQYEIPKGSQKHSLYAGALWIGGVDASNQLKVAAQTYRLGTTFVPNSGNDFWPGPLDITNASIAPEECNAYNRHWHITYDEVQDFVLRGDEPGYVMPEVIKNWPGNGDYRSSQDIPNLINPNFTHFLAPYHDADGDGNYDPNNRDYPLFDLTPGQTFCIDDMLFGDEAIWWVFNDMGNIHTETGGNPIGLEIQAQAFAFAKSDEINNMTFYHYKIINRSSSQVNNNYFGVWVDADLGKYDDDYVGCDVPRGLGYCYNGDAEDEGPTGYGFNPPAVGVDFFRGPKADPNDGIDNDRDCEIDDSLETELIIMSKYLYYNNDNNPVNGNPNTAQDYYNYLRGIWKNGQPMTYGGNGVGGTIPCSFMYPGNTDHQWEWGTGGDCATNSPASPQPDWDEYSAGNLPLDRRFLQSAGPFTLKPGAVNYITTGAVWARASQGGPLASVNLLQSADDKAQALFENCFKVLNGPDAPEVTIRELNNELILSIGNSGASNNYQEAYQERDPYITYTGGGPPYTSYYRFQGYQIFQVLDQSVTASDVHDLNKARLVAQVDIKDQVGQIVNYYFDINLGAFVPVEEVNGADKGIVHSFKVTTDAFASGDNRLINHKNYFFMAVAYGFNSDELGGDPNISGGQKQPYIPGRRNVKVYTGIPHNPSPQNYGQILNSSYGSGPQITRVEGTGNGYVVDYTLRATLDLTSESVNQILSAATGYKAVLPTYVAGRGPIDVKVYDPVKVPNAQFRFWLEDVSGTAHWFLKNLSNGDVEMSETNIEVPNEQLFPKWGLSVNIAQVSIPFTDARKPGFIEATMTFADPTKQWLTGVSDVDIDGTHPLDWITSTSSTPSAPGDTDRTQTYEQVLDGTWAPYMLCNVSPEGPASNTPGPTPNLNLIQNIPSIDVVFTPDKSKWTKCVVLETNNEPLLVGAPKLSVKNRTSLDVDGNPVTDGDMGRSYFPGYAINVETGERLNMMFGEDSWKAGENGNDMKWNPTSNMFTPLGQPLLGGKHFIYIVNTNHNPVTSGNFNPILLMNGYDGGDAIKQLLSTGTTANLRRVFRNVCWVGFPLLVSGKELLATEVKVRLRVTRPYASFPSGSIVQDGQLVPGQVYAVYEGRITHDGNDYSAFEHFTAANPNFSPFPANNTIGVVMTTENKGYPVYTFSTEGLMNENNNVSAAKNALDLINVVPNPYYAYSAYEGTLVAGVTVQPQLDNRIRIVNLPPKCVISIYTVNGTLVKRFNRDVAADNSLGSQVGSSDEGSISGKNFETAQDWDLKNHKNVPVSSGLYLIHVEAPGLGERTVKWFGAMRPIDLDAF